MFWQFPFLPKAGKLFSPASHLAQKAGSYIVLLGGAALLQITALSPRRLAWNILEGVNRKKKRKREKRRQERRRADTNWGEKVNIASIRNGKGKYS